MKEIEVKILEINPTRIRTILKGNNSKFIKKVLQKNLIYASPHTKTKGLTVRLRKEGRRTIFTLKESTRFIRGHKVRKEHETDISDFRTAEKILLCMGLKKIGQTEVKREYWKLHNCSVEIVNLPKIPTYLEIEGTEKNILKVAKKLGYSKKDYFPGYPYDYYKVSPKNLVFKN